MFGWMKRRRVRAVVPPGAPADPELETIDVGDYRRLQKYLRERYANRVVLTFSEIEDLLGFSLPGLARRQLEWWGSAGAEDRSAQSDSWRLAGRSAVVNLLAQTVVFDRQPA